jgi:phosphoribosylanthranilate isomerase
MTRVKVCGITNVQDAQMAVSLGADAIGFVFAKSPRRVTPKKAAEITKSLGPWVSKVGVFVNEKPAVMKRIAKLCNLDSIQLHGDEPPVVLNGLKGLKVIKAVRVDCHFSAKQIAGFKPDAFLFDTKTGGQYGGTGKVFDWSLLQGLKTKRPVILSGGLNAGNVKEAIRRVKPYGVDVSSGVEEKPGKKNARLLKEFMKNAKS